MEGGIDEIGPDLEALYPKTASAECGHDSGCDRGLAYAAMRSRNDNAWSAHWMSLRCGSVFKSGRLATVQAGGSSILRQEGGLPPLCCPMRAAIPGSSLVCSAAP